MAYSTKQDLVGSVSAALASFSFGKKKEEVRSEQKVSFVVDSYADKKQEQKLPPASIILILDESGSMSSNRLEILQAVNKFVKEQQAQPSDGTTLSVLTFDEKVKVLFTNKPLNDVALLTEKDYKPDGMTALYDAVGSAIDDHVGRERVLMVVVTDGQENSSKKYNKSMIKSKIDTVKACGWNFIFLANDIETSSGGDDVGFGKAAAGATYSSVNNVAVGYKGMSRALSGAVSEAATVYRASSLVPNMNKMASEYE